MTTKWTPGPWKVVRHSLGWFVEPVGRRCCAIAQADGFGDEQAKANAFLIAAAPELYEALESLVVTFWGTCGGGPEQDLRHAKEVLAKARGEAAE